MRQEPPGMAARRDHKMDKTGSFFSTTRIYPHKYIVNMTDPPVSPPRIFVFDHPRAVSQMSSRLFQNHEELENIFHPFMGASKYGPERIQLALKHSSVAEDTQNDLASNAHRERETYQAAAQRLTETIPGSRNNSGQATLFRAIVG